MKLGMIPKLHSDLPFVKEFVCDKCGFDIVNLQQNLKSAEYGACSFLLNGMTVQFRVSKITPTKAGQFVSIWKRNKDGITEPFDISDDIDFIVIFSKSGNNFGLFVFPKLVLANNRVITANGKEGKRGMRVYPPWDVTTNRTAQKTQHWQTKYFLTIKEGITSELDWMKKLFTQTEENF